MSVALLLAAAEGNAVLAETAKKNVNVKAPFVTVDGAGTKVKAPFLDYDSTGGAANVKAPFVNVGNGQVKAPFVNLTAPGAQTGAAGQTVPPLTSSTQPDKQIVSPNDAMGLSGAPGNPLALPNQFPPLGAPGTQSGAQGNQLGAPATQFGTPGQTTQLAPGQTSQLAPGQTAPGGPAGQLAPGQTGQPSYLGQPAGTGLSNFLGKFINIENTPTGGIHVKAPFVDVNTGSGNVDVKAPFVDVHQ